MCCLRAEGLRSAGNTDCTAHASCIVDITFVVVVSLVVCFGAVNLCMSQPRDVERTPGSGHLVAYDDSAKWMMVSHGMNWKGELMDDTWTLDIHTGAWTRESSLPGMPRPPKGALSAFVSSGTMLFTVGGLADSASLMGHSDSWVLQTSTMLWRPVLFANMTSMHLFPTASESTPPEGGLAWDNAVRPTGRTQSVAVKLDAFGGLLEPVLILGGKEGHAVDGMPLNDIWVFDSVPINQVSPTIASPGAPPAIQDSMATFDGEQSSQRSTEARFSFGNVRCGERSPFVLLMMIATSPQ